MTKKSEKNVIGYKKRASKSSCGVIAERGRKSTKGKSRREEKTICWICLVENQYFLLLLRIGNKKEILITLK